MKNLNGLALFLGGVAIGGSLGFLLFSEETKDTREKIKKVLREKGIKLDRSELDDLVDDLTREMTTEE